VKVILPGGGMFQLLPTGDGIHLDQRNKNLYYCALFRIYSGKFININTKNKKL